MVGPNTRSKKFWSSEEDRKVVKGYNRHYEDINVYKAIESDPEFNFCLTRSNVDIKDRLRILHSRLITYQSFFVLPYGQPECYIPDEFLNFISTAPLDYSETILVDEPIELDKILFQFSTSIDSFRIFLENLPLILEEDPILSSKTVLQVFNKYFTGRSKLTAESRDRLLNLLMRNGYVKIKQVGIRKYFYK